MPVTVQRSTGSRRPRRWAGIVAGTRVADILAALVAAGPSASWPQHLVEACRDATHMTGVGIAFVDEAGIGGVVAATDGAAHEMEALQFALGEGPCMEASRSGRPVLCPSLAQAAVTRWPAFAPAAQAAGVAAAFTFPLQVGAIALGVLDLYRDSSGPLSGSQPQEAVAFADAAVAVLLHLHEQEDRPPEDAPSPGGRGLVDLVDRRAVVHQAVGMVSVQLDIPLADALLRLRAHAWVQDRSISDVAVEVVARRVRFDHSRDGTTDGSGGPESDSGPGRTFP